MAKQSEASKKQRTGDSIVIALVVLVPIGCFAASRRKSARHDGG